MGAKPNYIFRDILCLPAGRGACGEGSGDEGQPWAKTATILMHSSAHLPSDVSTRHRDGPGIKATPCEYPACEAGKVNRPIGCTRKTFPYIVGGGRSPKCLQHPSLGLDPRFSSLLVLCDGRLGHGDRRDRV